MVSLSVAICTMVGKFLDAYTTKQSHKRDLHGHGKKGAYKNKNLALAESTHSCQGKIVAIYPNLIAKHACI